MLPSDLPSFLWGLLTGAVVIVFGGFGAAAGSDLWHWLKAKLKNEPPEPIEVSPRFSPDRYPPRTCAWVPEVDVPLKEEKGWGFYPHPKSGGACFRKAKNRGVLINEFLMVPPEVLGQAT